MNQTGRYLLPVACFFLFFFSFSEPVFSQEAVWVDAEEQLQYANRLFQENDYTNALSEYKRFLYFFPKDNQVGFVKYRIGLSLFYSKKWEDCIAFFRKFSEDHAGTRYAQESYLWMAKSYLLLNRKGEAILTLNDLASFSTDPDIQDGANYELGWLWLDHPSGRMTTAENDRQAMGYFRKISAEGKKRYAMDQLTEELRTYRELPEKNPVIAGVLSILPGMGQLYCERYQDALTASLVNAAFGLAAVEAFDHKSYALGSLISMVAIGFYAGNVYGAATNAHKFNRVQRRHFINDIRSRTKHVISSRLTEKGMAMFFYCRF